jgi:flagellar motor switch protein FliN/FliY
MTEAKSTETATTSPAEDKWAHVQELACHLSVELPVPGFRVRDLVRLQAQAVINTRWPVGNDVPLRLNGQLLAWCEFEVVENKLAVRVTELG